MWLDFNEAIPTDEIIHRLIKCICVLIWWVGWSLKESDRCIFVDTEEKQGKRFEDVILLECCAF
jgi:hypothetical protein